MMDQDSQLKLQAYLDGELAEAEAREMANWIAKDRDAAALYAELRNTRQSMVGFEVGVTLPESRDFFWSKVRREIERQEPEPDTAALPVSTPWSVRIRRFLLPASAVALLAIAGLVAVLPSGGGSDSGGATEDTDAFTYRDYSAGTTLVWFSYPAENDFAEDPPADIVE
jgi:anti-sigma factor RsiW